MQMTDEFNVNILPIMDQVDSHEIDEISQFILSGDNTQMLKSIDDYLVNLTMKPMHIIMATFVHWQMHHPGALQVLLLRLKYASKTASNTRLYDALADALLAAMYHS